MHAEQKHTNVPLKRIFKVKTLLKVSRGVLETHLHPRLGQVDLQRQLLARVDVWVVRLREHALQLLQLRAREGRADAPLLALLVQTGGVREELVRN